MLKRKREIEREDWKTIDSNMNVNKVKTVLYSCTLIRPEYYHRQNFFISIKRNEQGQL